MAYCMMIPRKRLLLDEDLLDSTVMQWRRWCTTVLDSTAMQWWRRCTTIHMTVYFFIIYPARKHEKYSKRPTMAYMELTNQAQSSRTDCMTCYYWQTMIADVVEYARRCKACQIHANFIHQPLELLHPIVASWPFEVWGIDVVGPVSPPSAKGHQFILAITDNFSKWAEVAPFAEVKTTNMVNFIKHHVIHQFCVPRRIVHDNGLQFASQSFYQFCNKYQIHNVISTAYNPFTNGLAEAFNKTIIKLLMKFISSSKRDWN